MAGNTFEELLREVDDIESDELMGGLEDRPDSDLDFDDDNSLAAFDPPK